MKPVGRPPTGEEVTSRPALDLVTTVLIPPHLSDFISTFHSFHPIYGVRESAPSWLWSSIGMPLGWASATFFRDEETCKETMTNGRGDLYPDTRLAARRGQAVPFRTQ